MIGKCSSFGGMSDTGMKNDTGLALYEPWEADRRGDMFFPEDVAWPNSNAGARQPTWQRLRTDFPYIALRFDHKRGRQLLQRLPYKVENLKTGSWEIGFLVDWGPNEETNRYVDLSPGLMKRLDLHTDDEVCVFELRP